MQPAETTPTTTSPVPATQFSFCMPRQPQPCIQYTGENLEALNTFLRYFGGQDAFLEKDGSANIFTTYRGETRHCYCKPGGWVRVLGTCQFTAMSDPGFEQLYTLV